MKIISHPVLCNYYVTYRCNAACDFCDIWERPSPYIQLDEVKANLADLKKMGVKVIDFTGGEPLLHRQIDVLLREAKKMGFITTLTTNCLLYPKWADKIKGLVDMLHFSLDSPDPEKHNASRKVEAFSFFKASIEKALSLGERPDILFTVTEENTYEIEQVYKEYVLGQKLVLILNPIFDYNEVDAGGLSSATLKTLYSWLAKPGIYLNKAFLKLRENGGNHIHKPVCKASSSTIVISPFNELILPCYHLEKWKFPINNQLASLYAGKEVQDLVGMEGRLPECEGCVVNCYMQPSFSVNMNKYWWWALPSTIKYNRMKGTWKKMFSGA